MYEGIPYCRTFDSSIGRCSIDNLRIKFSFRFKHFDFNTGNLCPFVDYLCQQLDSIMEVDGCPLDLTWSYCDFFRIGNYKRTATFSGDLPFDGSFSFAILIGRYTYDTTVKQVAPECILDINPNKVPLTVLNRFISFLRSSSYETKILRFDLAVDILQPREDVLLTKNARQDYRRFESEEGLTEYQGKRSKHNALKLYDKSKELGLPYACTRCEMTIEMDKWKGILSSFPQLTLYGSLQMDMSFSKLPFQVQACLRHPDLVEVMKDTLTRNTYAKYYQMIRSIQQCNLIPCDAQQIDNFVTKTLFEYLRFTDGLYRG